MAKRPSYPFITFGVICIGLLGLPGLFGGIVFLSLGITAVLGSPNALEAIKSSPGNLLIGFACLWEAGVCFLLASLAEAVRDTAINTASLRQD